MAEKSTQQVIARAIKKADKSYFFEDYNKQAAAVIKALRKEGLAILPKEATEEMASYASDNMMSGKVRPTDHVSHVYKTMVEFATRQK